MKMQSYYEFGPFRMDVRDRLLTRSGQTVSLAPKTFDLLLYLVENRGRILEKEALLEQVWKGVFVEESNLTKNVFLLRKYLGERENGKPYIETFPKRGYRFDADVSEFVEGLPAKVPEPKQPEPADGPPRRLRRLSLSIVLVIISVAGASVVLRWWRPASRPFRSIAVLPFRIVGPASDAYLSEGLAEELSVRLVRINGLRVIAPELAGRFRNSPDLQQVGRELGVDGVLTGSVQTKDGRLRGRVELVGTRDGLVLWADSSLDVPLRDLLLAEQGLAETVATGLRFRLTPPEQAALSKAGTRNPDAYELVLRGAHYLTSVRGSRPQDRDLATAFFRQAIQLDSGYADGHAWLAMALIGPPAEIGLAMAHAKNALSIDPDQTIAHLALVEVFHYLGQEEEALPHARNVLARAKDDPKALRAAGWAYFRAGILGRGISLLAEALQIDPRDELSRQYLGLAYLLTGQHLKGIEVLAPVADSPNNREVLALHHADSGDCRTALGLARSLRGVSRDPVINYFLGKLFEQCGEPYTARAVWLANVVSLERALLLADDLRTRLYLALEDAELGRRRQAMEQVRQAQVLGPGNPRVLFICAEAMAVLRNRSDALSYLRQAADRGFVEIYYLDHHQRKPLPLYGLKDDPDFRAIRDNVALRIRNLAKIYDRD